MMLMFHRRHPEIAKNETAMTVIDGNDPIVPAGEYCFVEWFCADPACDCRRVVFTVASLKTPAVPVAAIEWGWESREYYRKFFKSDDLAEAMVEGMLDVAMPQSEYADTMLALFQQRMEADELWRPRVAEHYALFKRGIINEAIGKHGVPMTRQQRRQAEREMRKGRAVG